MGQPLFVFTVSMAHSKDRHNPLCILRNTLEISIPWPRPIPTCIRVFVATSMTTPIERTNNDQWGNISVRPYWHATKSNFLNCCRSICLDIFSLFFAFLSFYPCYFDYDVLKKKNVLAPTFVEIILETRFSSGFYLIRVSRVLKFYGWINIFANIFVERGDMIIKISYIRKIMPREEESFTC